MSAVDTKATNSNSPKTKKLLGKAGLYLAAVVILLSIGLLAYTLTSKHRRDAMRVCSNNQEGSLLHEAAELLDPTDSQKMRQLEGTVEKIQKTEGHQKDFNCVYPLTVHYIYTADKDKAKEHYEYLKQAQDRGQTLSEAYSYRTSVEEIKTQIDLFDIRQKEDAENALVF